MLAGLSTDRRRFLLHTSVLTRLSGGLCDAVTGRLDGAEMLAGIERSNLFLVPLDHTRGWYRYHHLFAELLSRELDRSQPELVSDLHRRASDWYREQGEVDDAVRHATAAGDLGSACDLIATHWNEFANEGKLVTVATWLDALPAGTVEADARLCLARAWHALLTNRNDHVERWINRAEATVMHGPARDWTSSIGAGAALIRTIHLYYVGDIAGCELWARRALELELEPVWYSMAYSGVAAAHYWQEEEQAAAALERTASLALGSGNVLSAMWALEFRALLAAEDADPDAVERFVGQALTLAAEHGLEAHWVHAAGHLALAHAHELRGDLAAASCEAQTALDLVRRGPGRLETALTLITVARLLPKRAAESLAEAHRTIATCPDPGFLRAQGTGEPLRRHAVSSDDDLSKRELQVLRLLTTKLTLREIGAELSVSENTVRTHARSIYRKLDATSRVEAVAGARELNLL
ncbi:MAG TPA: LuxR C-terminal-related transcriptional regulator [Gaiellaceae bacterium]